MRPTTATFIQNLIVAMSIRLAKCLSNAVQPTQTTHDAALTLSVVDVRAWPAENVTLYRTGWQAVPPNGYHLELLPHPSLHKHGYMLANAPLLIEPTNRAELMAPLYKFDPHKPDLPLPCRALQLVLRRTIPPAFDVHPKVLEADQTQ